MTASLQDRKLENSRLLREDIARRSTTFRAFPEIIGLHTTEICNLRCVQCPRHERQGRQVLPREQMKQVCESLFPTARKAILTAAAGEPLLSDYDLVLEQALRHQVLLDVITNGTLLTPELFVRSRPVLDHINVSLDAPEPELYRRIRGGDFARVIDNLRQIRDRRTENPDDVLLTLSAVVMRENLSALPEFVRLGAELGVSGVIFQRLQHQVKNSRSRDPYLDPGLETVRAICEEACAVALESGVNLFLGELGLTGVEVKAPRDKRPPPIEGQGLCWFVAQEFAVMYTGEVYPCCFVTDHMLGNLWHQTPMEIWNSRTARRLRAAHFSGRGTLFCRGCIHAPHLSAADATRRAEFLKLSRRAVAHVRSRIRQRIRPWLGGSLAKKI